jgi:hypothetical protein
VEIPGVYDRVEALDVITRSLRDYEHAFGPQKGAKGTKTDHY